MIKVCKMGKSKEKTFNSIADFLSFLEISEDELTEDEKELLIKAERKYDTVYYAVNPYVSQLYSMEDDYEESFIFDNNLTALEDRYYELSESV